MLCVVVWCDMMWYDMMCDVVRWDAVKCSTQKVRKNSWIRGWSSVVKHSNNMTEEHALMCQLCYIYPCYLTNKYEVGHREAHRATEQMPGIAKQECAQWNVLLVWNSCIALGKSTEEKRREEYRREEKRRGEMTWKNGRGEKLIREQKFILDELLTCRDARARSVVRE